MRLTPAQIALRFVEPRHELFRKRRGRKLHATRTPLQLASVPLVWAGKARFYTRRVLRILESRLVLWALASLSFAALLGHFYGFWSMRVFTPCILLPATILLVILAFKGQSQTRFIIVQGALAGLFAAVVYDVFRVPFVLAGKPLFGVFPQFGQLLLYGHLVKDDASLPVQFAGWTYHFQNGMALGIMGAAMIPISAKPVTRFWICVAWATGVEIFLLVSPYYRYLGLHMPMSQFVPITLAAHLIFGVALGWYFSKRWLGTGAMRTA